MTRIVDLLAEVVPTLGTPRDGLPASGIHVDELTGGLHPGGLWRIQGPSESGRTTLALQVAREAALLGVPTVLFTPQHDQRATVARILSGTYPLTPLHHLLRGPLIPENDAEHLRMAADRLSDTPLVVYCEPAAVSDAWAQLLRGNAGAAERVIVVDDYDLFASWSYGEPHGPDRLRQLAQEWNATIITTAATNSSTWGEPWVPGLVPPDWSRFADVVIDLDRHDQRGMIERAGEIDLHVVRNSYGPSACVTLAFQGHFVRAVPFIAMA